MERVMYRISFTGRFLMDNISIKSILISSNSYELLIFLISPCFKITPVFSFPRFVISNRAKKSSLGSSPYDRHWFPARQNALPRVSSHQSQEVSTFHEIFHE